MWGLFVSLSFYVFPPSFETGSCFLDQVLLKLRSSCLQLQNYRHAFPCLALDKILFSLSPACPSASKLFVGPLETTYLTLGAIQSKQNDFYLLNETCKFTEIFFYWAKFSQKKTKVLWESRRRNSSLWLRKSKKTHGGVMFERWFHQTGGELEGFLRVGKITGWRCKHSCKIR